MLILIRLDDEDFSCDSGIEKLTQLWVDVSSVDQKVDQMTSEFDSCFEVSNRNKAQIRGSLDLWNKVETFKYIEPDSK